MCRKTLVHGKVIQNGHLFSFGVILFAYRNYYDENEMRLSHYLKTQPACIRVERVKTSHKGSHRQLSQMHPYCSVCT